MKLDPRAILARQRLPDGRVVVLARGPAGAGAYIIETPGGDRAPRPVRPPLFTGAGRGAGGQEERA